MSRKPHARRTTRSAIALYLAVALGVSAAFVAAAAPAGASSVTVTVNPLVLYASTGVTVSPGDLVTIERVGLGQRRLRSQLPELVARREPPRDHGRERQRMPS